MSRLSGGETVFATKLEKFHSDNTKMESLRFAHGVSIIELLNKVLVERSVLEKLVRENNVERVSSELPGLIVQVRVSPIFRFKVGFFLS